MSTSETHNSCLPLNTYFACSSPLGKKRLLCVLAIITAIGALAVAAVGLAGLGASQGWWAAGSLSNLHQINALIMISVGGAGGITLLVLGIASLVKYHSQVGNPKKEEKTEPVDDSGEWEKINDEDEWEQFPTEEVPNEPQLPQVQNTQSVPSIEVVKKILPYAPLEALKEQRSKEVAYAPVMPKAEASMAVLLNEFPYLELRKHEILEKDALKPVAKNPQNALKQILIDAKEIINGRTKDNKVDEQNRATHPKQIDLVVRFCKERVEVFNKHHTEEKNQITLTDFENALKELTDVAECWQDLLLIHGERPLSSQDCDILKKIGEKLPPSSSFFFARDYPFIKVALKTLIEGFNARFLKGKYGELPQVAQSLNEKLGVELKPIKPLLFLGNHNLAFLKKLDKDLETLFSNSNENTFKEETISQILSYCEEEVQKLHTSILEFKNQFLEDPQAINPTQPSVARKNLADKIALFVSLNRIQVLMSDTTKIDQKIELLKTIVESLPEEEAECKEKYPLFFDMMNEILDPLVNRVFFNPKFKIEEKEAKEIFRLVKELGEKLKHERLSSLEYTEIKLLAFSKMIHEILSETTQLDEKMALVQKIQEGLQSETSEGWEKHEKLIKEMSTLVEPMVERFFANPQITISDEEALKVQNQLNAIGKILNNTLLSTFDYKETKPFILALSLMQEVMLDKTLVHTKIELLGKIINTLPLEENKIWEKYGFFLEKMNKTLQPLIEHFFANLNVYVGPGNVSKLQGRVNQVGKILRNERLSTLNYDEFKPLTEFWKWTKFLLLDTTPLEMKIELLQRITETLPKEDDKIWEKYGDLLEGMNITLQSTIDGLFANPQIKVSTKETQEMELSLNAIGKMLKNERLSNFKYEKVKPAVVVWQMMKEMIVETTKVEQKIALLQKVAETLPKEGDEIWNEDKNIAKGMNVTLQPLIEQFFADPLSDLSDEKCKEIQQHANAIGKILKNQVLATLDYTEIKPLVESWKMIKKMMKEEGHIDYKITLLRSIAKTLPSKGSEVYKKYADVHEGMGKTLMPLLTKNFSSYVFAVIKTKDNAAKYGRDLERRHQIDAAFLEMATKLGCEAPKLPEIVMATEHDDHVAHNLYDQERGEIEAADRWLMQNPAFLENILRN